MSATASSEMLVVAQVERPALSAQQVKFVFREPPDNTFVEDRRLRLDLCLTPRPRNARGSYPERWTRSRFERLGAVFMVPPGESLLARSDSTGEQHSLLCQLDPTLIAEWLDEEFCDETHLAAGLDINSSNVLHLLGQLKREIQQPGLASDLLIDGIATQLSVELLRFHQSVSQRDTAKGLSPWRLRLIDEHIRDANHLPTLSELAALCGLSVRQLSRSFRASRGCSLGEYAATKRLEIAKELLDRDHSVKAVAYTLGFASPSGFCSAFKRHSGQTPGEYRAERVLIKRRH